MNKYKRLITTAFNEVYLANNPTIKQSQELAHKFIQDIIQKARADFGSEIDEFITQRDKSHKAIMSTTQQEVSSFLSASLVGLPFVKVIAPASSFSFDLYLPGESDLDFVVTILNINKEKLAKVAKILQDNGYAFESEHLKGKPDSYHVYQHNINGIEIEVKVRDHEHCARILKISAFLETYPVESKKPLTYLKKLMKSDKNTYSKLKYLIYENALYESGWKDSLFGCHIKEGLM